MRFTLHTQWIEVTNFKELEYDRSLVNWNSPELTGKSPFNQLIVERLSKIPGSWVSCLSKHRRCSSAGWWGELLSQCLDGPATGAEGVTAEPREVLSVHSQPGGPLGQGPAGWAQKITALGPHQLLCRTWAPGLNSHLGSENHLTCQLTMCWKVVVAGMCVAAKGHDTTQRSFLLKRVFWAQ